MPRAGVQRRRRGLGMFWCETATCGLALLAVIARSLINPGVIVWWVLDRLPAFEQAVPEPIVELGD